MDKKLEQVVIKIGERRYPAWKQASIMLSLERLSGEFDVSGSGQWTEDRKLVSTPIRAGQKCALSIGGETVLTGAIDTAPNAFSTSDTGVKVRGRDRTALLNDCSLEGKSWNGMGISTIAADLCGMFGIPVRLVNFDGGKTFAKYAVDPGETVLSALEDACRQLGIMMWTDGLGTLMIGRPAGGPHVGTLELKKHIKEAEGGPDHSDRFHTYKVVGQRSGGELWDKNDHSQIGVATDPEIDPRRVRVIVAESQVEGGATAQQRAEHECRVRKARGSVVNATIYGWRAPNGAILRPGQRMDIACKKLGAAGTLMLAEVNLSQGTSEGTIARLKLMPAAAFDVLAEGNKKDGGVWS